MHSLEETLKRYRRNLEEPKKDWPPNIHQSVLFIHDYLYDRRLTVKWLKKECEISAGSFSTQFMHFKNYYPKKYILHHRMETSKLLLRKTDLTVTMVAVTVGFNSHSAFCKTFKTKVGHIPSDWRKGNKVTT